jgi:chromosome segregation ATPase
MSNVFSLPQREFLSIEEEVVKKLVLSTIVVLSAIVLSALFLPTAIAAQPDVDALKKEKSALQDAMKALEKEFDLNEAKKPRLEQRQSDLEWTAKTVKKEIEKRNAANARLQTKINTYEADVATHNSQCDRTLDTQSEYDRCQGSKAALDSRRATLVGEIQYDNEQRATVKGLIDNQKEQEQILQREIDEYNAHRQELIEAGLKIQARLDEIQPYINSCQEAIAAYDRSPDPTKDGTMERMKAECGRMFDGS